MNSFNEELTSFLHALEQHDWFCDAELDHFGKFVVYVDKMDIPFIGATPDKIGGHQVLFHYIASQPMLKSHIKPVVINKIEAVKPLQEVEENVDLARLTYELFLLEKECGSNILQDIFYEIHDGDNAVTNHGNKFPHSKYMMEALYDEYGFDLIYEELDG